MWGLPWRGGIFIMQSLSTALLLRPFGAVLDLRGNKPPEATHIYKYYSQEADTVTTII